MSMKKKLFWAVIAILLLIAIGHTAYWAYQVKTEEAEAARIVTIDNFEVTGRVTYGVSELPVEGAAVIAVINGNISLEALTDSNGYYQIDLPPYNSTQPYVIVLAAQKEKYLSIGPALTQITMTKRGADITLNDNGRLTEENFIMVPESYADKEDILKMLRDYNIRIIDANNKTVAVSATTAILVDVNQKDNVPQEEYPKTKEVLAAHNFEQWTVGEKEDLTQMMAVTAGGGQVNPEGKSTRVLETYIDLLEAAGY